MSHLQHARHLNTVSKVKAATNSDHTPIIVYCSIGYRSSALAGKLQKAGLANVWNLEGSIFAWANEGRPVFRGAQQVFEVHPYSAKWGNLVEARFRPERKG